MSDGSGGTSWPGAATTTRGATTSPSSRTTRGSMSSPAKGSQALGRPMRRLRPPQSTMPPIITKNLAFPAGPAQATLPHGRLRSTAAPCKDWPYDRPYSHPLRPRGFRQDHSSAGTPSQLCPRRSGVGPLAGTDTPSRRGPLAAPAGRARWPGWLASADLCRVLPRRGARRRSGCPPTVGRATTIAARGDGAGPGCGGRVGALRESARNPRLR